MDKKKFIITLLVVLLVVAIAVAAVLLLKKEPTNDKKDILYLEDVEIDEETQAILENDLKVFTLAFAITYGQETKGFAPVNLTNQTEDPKSYDVTLEAFVKETDAEGKIIEDSKERFYDKVTFEALDLVPGERTRFVVFEDFDKEDYDLLSKGKFIITKVVEK